jgi:hypothetical protein
MSKEKHNRASTRSSEEDYISKNPNAETAVNPSRYYVSNDPVLLPPETIKILILTEGGGSFIESLDQDFSLSILVDVLNENIGLDPKIEVTKAHRASSVGPDVLRDFRFKPRALDGFHEVWLFGILDFSTLPLDDSEIEVLTEFMHSGGGVFATGDHDGRGTPLCGKISRVRNMRQWGKPLTVTSNSDQRFDTLRSGDDDIYQFTDESDDTAQEIFPIIVSGTATRSACPSAYPHPLLCSPTGVIRFLPDHRHEGTCISKPDLTQKIKLDGKDVDEYPTVNNSPSATRISPQLVAKARADAPHTTVDNNSACFPFTQIDSFEAIVVYDGHRIQTDSDGHTANIGRVVVDSSFHHFVNMNLKGFRNSPRINTIGKGQLAYNDIKRYFRNIAVWLAPKPIQEDLRWRGLWRARWTYPLTEELSSFAYQNNPGQQGWETVLRIGEFMHDTLRRLGLDCEISNWISDLLNSKAPRNALSFLADPWASLPNFSGGSLPLLDTRTIHTAILGGVAIQLSINHPDPFDIKRNDADIFLIGKSVLETAIKNGASIGVSSLQKYLTEMSQRIEQALQLFDDF